MELTKEDALKSIVIESDEVVYWKKALSESDTVIEKLESGLKYERAVNDMCKQKLDQAISLQKEADK